MSTNLLTVSACLSSGPPPPAARSGPITASRCCSVYSHSHASYSPLNIRTFFSWVGPSSLGCSYSRGGLPGLPTLVVSLWFHCKVGNISCPIIIIPRSSGFSFCNVAFHQGSNRQVGAYHSPPLPFHYSHSLTSYSPLNICTFSSCVGLSSLGCSARVANPCSFTVRLAIFHVPLLPYTDLLVFSFSFSNVSNPAIPLI